MSAGSPPTRFEPLGDRHIEEAIALAHEAYVRECRHVPALIADGVPDMLRQAIIYLIQQGRGVAAVDGERLLGYMAFYGPFEGFFGTGTGCFSPLHGNAATGDNPTRLTSLLFQYAAELLTAEGANTFAITTYRHDDETAMGLSLNGFGIRNTDAIRAIEPPLQTVPVPGVTCREVHWSDAGPLLPLLNGLVRHLRQSPTFVAADEFTTEAFAERRERRQTRFFVAFDDGTPIGYMELADDGENVLTTASDMRNICGAFLAEAYRGRGIYRNLLALVLATLRDQGVQRLGVDFETMNPTALNFWTKHFDRYTTSFARRIDDLG